MEQLFSITQNCDFTIRIRARRVGYNRYVGVSFDEMSGLIVNLINLPSQKIRLAYTVDEQGRLVIPVTGEGLACNLYGIEIIGFYNNGNWRHQIAPAFDIVKASAQDNYALCETDDCTLDFEITIGDTNVSTRLLTKSMNEHNNDQNAHPELVQALNNARQAIHDLQELIPQIENQIAEAGEVNDIRIDGQSILDQNKVANFNSDDFSHVNNIKVNGEPVIDENKEANIVVPTTVEELNDSADFAKKTDLQNAAQQLEQAIDDAAVSEVEATVDNNTGTPEVDYSFENGKIQLDFKNLKGDKGDPLTWNDLSDAQKASLKGPMGESIAPQEGMVPVSHVLGNDAGKVMSQKGVSDSRNLMAEKMLGLEDFGLTVKSSLTIDETTNTVIEKSNNTHYKVAYSKVPFSIGDVIRAIGEGTEARAWKFGFTTVDPSSLESLEDLELEAVEAYTDITHDHAITVPREGAWLVASFNEMSWVSREWKVARLAANKQKISELDEELSGLASNVDTFKEKVQGKKDILRTQRCNVTINVSSGTIDAESGTLYSVDCSCEKFAKGDLIKLSGIATQTRAITIGFTTANLSDLDGLVNQPLTDVQSWETTSHEHYVTVPYDNAYIAIYRYLQHWTEFHAEVFKAEMVSDMVASAQNAKIENIKANKCQAEVTTLIPSVHETYNAYYRSSYGKQFQANSDYLKRLTYVPAVFLKGGTTLKVRFKSNEKIQAYEFPYIPLEEIPINSEAWRVYTGYKTADINTEGTDYGEDEQEYTITLKDTTRRIAFVLGSGNNVAISPSQITDFIVSLEASVQNPDTIEVEEDDEDTDAREDIKDKARQAKYKLIDTSHPLKTLGLLHFSDIHGDQEAADTILREAAKLGTLVDDILCTGDSCLYYADGTSSYPQGAQWWIEESGLADKSLFVLGNHDSATSAATQYDQYETSAAWDGKGEQYCHDTYFEPFAADLGIQLPSDHDTTNACYWYKDYPDSKIRLIGLDCLHRHDGILNPQTGAIVEEGLKSNDNKQELWLIARLNETLNGSGNTAEGYKVIVACHYGLDNFSGKNINEETGECNQNVDGGIVMNRRTNDVVNFHQVGVNALNWDKRFCLRNRVDNGYSQGQEYGSSGNYTKGNVNNIGEIIKSWMANGGKFIAWLSGHTHHDYMCYSTDYPDILQIGVDQAGYKRGGKYADRQEGTNARTVANFYGIDPDNNIIKIVRIGLDMDKLMISKRYMMYVFSTRIVYSEG